MSDLVPIFSQRGTNGVSQAIWQFVVPTKLFQYISFHFLAGRCSGPGSAKFVSNLVAEPEDRFSRDEALFLYCDYSL